MHAKLNLGAATLVVAFGPTALIMTGCNRVRRATGFPPPPIPMQQGNPIRLPPAGVNPEPGAFAPAEWKRLEAVGQRLEKTQTLSSADIAFAASLLHSKPPVDTPKVEEDRQRMVLAQLCGTRPKNLTPAQGRQLFNAVLPSTSSPSPIVRTNAMLVLASSHDPEAMSVLQWHARNDPEPFNRKFAGDLERRLGVALKIPQHS